MSDNLADFPRVDTITLFDGVAPLLVLRFGGKREMFFSSGRLCAVGFSPQFCFTDRELAAVLAFIEAHQRGDPNVG
jgi:hypothetical protein